MRSLASAFVSGQTGARATGFRGRRLARLCAIAALLLSTAACDGVDRLLTVTSPSRLSEENFLIPANALLISNSAVADFECAQGAYIVASGLAAGELVEGTQTAARWSYDRRDIEPNQAQYASAGCGAIGVYTPLNVARHTNDQAITLLEGWTDEQVPNRQLLIARNAAMAGHALVLLGEGFCSVAINVGPALTPAQAFQAAEERFTKAIAAAQAVGNASVENLALVGRARARLNRGDLAGAGQDAGLVPQSFVFSAEHNLNDGTRNNRIFAQNNQGFAVSVAPAYREMTVGAIPDPRVRAVDGDRNTTDQINRLWLQQKYGSLIAPTPIATGIEAKLIQAEAAGQGQGAAIINALRARTGVELPALTPSEILAFAETVAEERRRELWLQGNRWYDSNRLNLAQIPAAGAPYAKGGLYGTQRCWPLPDVERLANPNI